MKVGGAEFEYLFASQFTLWKHANFCWEINIYLYKHIPITKSCVI